MLQDEHEYSEVRDTAGGLALQGENKDGQFYWAKQLKFLFCKSRKK